MTALLHDSIRQKIRKQYSQAIKLKDFGMQSFSCSCENDILGYTKEDLAKVPKEANLALGCSNPKNYAQYRKGENVLDLGCGAGFDCFLASHEVGEEGKVFGVDMTPEMLTRAREIAFEYHYKNVEFRLGEIEHLPIENNSIDIIISNCVLNLSPNKEQATKECKRVLKEQGRLLLCDILFDDHFDEALKIEFKSNKSASCIGNALSVSEMKTMLEKHNFQDVSITLHEKSSHIIDSWLKNAPLKHENKIYSAVIQAFK